MPLSVLPTDPRYWRATFAVVVPGRLRQEELQALHGPLLRADHRFGAHQTGQGLVAVAWQQQALQVGAQAAALRQPGEQRVELGGVALQGTGGGWAGQALGHRGTSASSRMAQPPAFPLPAPANKPPLSPMPVS